MKFEIEVDNSCLFLVLCGVYINVKGSKNLTQC